LDKRKLEENFFKVLMIASTLIVIGGLMTVLVVVLFKGIPALNFAMITQLPQGGYLTGGGGGILNAIVGSLYLVGGATPIAFAIGLPVAFYLNEYAAKSRIADLTRRCFDILWSIPSIIYGAFGFTVMVYFGMRASLLGGIVVLTLLELPIMTRAMDEVVRVVPSRVKQASYALGATRFETTFHVVFRQALPGILTAVLLAFGRAIGDAASILFTAGYTQNIPNSIFSPVASLPLAIFYQLGTPYPEVQQKAYASAAILVVIVLIISIISIIVSRKFRKFIIT
jgi:phosphate transport system permease protein